MSRGKTHKKTLSLPARPPSHSAAVMEVVDVIMGRKSLYVPLPEDMPTLERIKVFARTGFFHRAEESEKDLEKLWQEAFPVTKG